MESREQDHQDDVREIIVDVNEKQTLLSLRISEDRDSETYALSMELSNPEDLSFLMYSDIHYEDYESVIMKQNVSVPYNQFISHFISILDRIYSSMNDEESKADIFSFSVCLQEQNEHCTLAVIQKSSFMTFPLLTIPFRRATDAEMNSYLVRLIAEFKDTGAIPVQASSILSQYKELQQRYQTDLISMQQQHEDAIALLSETYETQIKALQDQIDVLESQQTTTMEESQSNWNDKLQTLQNELEDVRNKLMVVQGERDEFYETVQSLQATAQSISSLTTVQSELSDELEQVLTLNSQLQSQLAEEETMKETLQTEVDQLRQQVETLSKTNTELTTSLEQAEEQLEENRRTMDELRQTNQTSALTLSQNELTIQTLNSQLITMKESLGKYEEEVKSLTHMNKIKDRALSCLNQEVNRMKLGMANKAQN